MLHFSNAVARAWERMIAVMYANSVGQRLVVELDVMTQPVCPDLSSYHDQDYRI
jgi:hypothetical protein